MGNISIRYYLFILIFIKIETTNAIYIPIVEDVTDNRLGILQYNDEYNTIISEMLLDEELSNYVVKLFCEMLQPKHLCLHYDSNVRARLVSIILKKLHNQCKYLPVTIFRYLQIKDQTQLWNSSVDKQFHYYNLHILSAISYQSTNISFREYKIPEKYLYHEVIIIDGSVYVGDWLSDIFRIFWTLEIMNVLIAFWANDTMNSYTYSPFTNEWSYRLPTDNFERTIMFRDKTKQINRYPLRISLFREESRLDIKPDNSLNGSDGFMTEYVVNKMNATMMRLPPMDGEDIGEFMQNGTITGSLFQIVNRTVDVSFNTRFLRLSQFKYLVEVTNTIGRDDICILVRKSLSGALMNNIFQSFHLNVWISTIAALVFIYINYRLFSFTTPPNFKFINFIAWNINQPTNRIPKQRYLNIIAFFWILYCFLITSAYIGNLTSHLMAPAKFSEINTILELYKAGYKIRTYNRYINLIDQFIDDIDAIPKSRRTDLIQGITAPEFFNHINHHDVKYAYANKYHIVYALSKNKSHYSRGIPIYNLMTECPVPYVVAYAVPYGSPYLARFNEIIRASQETGLQAYWEKGTKESQHLDKQRNDDEDISLALKHLQSAFYLLIVGNSISTLVFIIEIVYKYRIKINVVAEKRNEIR